jgi:gliding motility-associated-like protein
MRKFLFLQCIFLFCTVPAWSQSDCDRISFEKGRMGTWQLFYGILGDKDKRKIYLNEIEVTSDNQHDITSAAQGRDPKIPFISVVPPGSRHAVRIGDTMQGRNFSRIRTRYYVTPGRGLLQYRLAVVLQNSIDPKGDAHQAYQKPGITMTITDSTGRELACGNHSFQLQKDNVLEGFQAIGNLQYLNWTTGIVDLQAYAGKTVIITVTSTDCTGGGHLGYAYFDISCDPAIVQSSACPDDAGFLTLEAPSDFGRYTWSNGDTTRSIRVKAKAGDAYNVSVVPKVPLQNSCPVRLDYTMERRETKSTIDSTICEGEQLAVADTVYKTSGTFVRRIRLSSLCDSVITVNLRVIPMNLSVTPESYVTMGDSIHMLAEVEPAGNYQYLWRQESSLSCADCPDPWSRAVTASTQFTVTVTDDAHICTREGRVKVGVKPCGISVPDAFSPDHDRINDVFFVYASPCIVKIHEMAIYSRNGEMIFNKRNFKPSEEGQGWDGRYRGVLAEPGLYPYKIKAELLSGEIREFSGGVRLVR